MGETVWQQLDRMQAEYDKTKLLLRAVRGGRFMGRKPNGMWVTSISDKKPVDVGAELLRVHKREPRDVVAETAVALVLKAAAECCFICGCDTDLHGTREPTPAEVKSKHKKKMRCGGERRREDQVLPCTCARTPEEIQEKQGSREWIAERLKDYALRKDISGFRATVAANVFDGMRGAPAKRLTSPENGAAHG